MADVRDKLKGLPAKPGVYLFRDESAEVLYVGKAKSLRPRVRSYFQAGRGDTRASIPQLVDRIADLEVIVTSTEVEALHLEQNLVKRYRPPFNVRLRDDKSFPYIAVTVEDEYPRVMFTRERHRRGVLYFGPYANAKKVRETLDVLNRVFQFRPCEGPKPGRHSGIPCLDFHIERCHAPCVGYISNEAYGEVDRGRDQLPLRRHEDDRARAGAADARCGGRGAFRGRGPLPQPALRDREPRRAAGGRPPRDRLDRRARDRRRRGSCCGAGLPAPRRQDDRPARLPPRERRRTGRDDDPRGLLPRVLRQRSLDPAADRRAARGDGPRGAPGVPDRAARLAGRSACARAGREASARRAGGPERPGRARLGGGRLRAEADPSRGRARGAARGAQPRKPAAADRVLRHLEHPGPGDRRLDGGLPGRGREEGALPQVRGARARRPGRLRRDGRGRLAPFRTAADA